VQGKRLGSYKAKDFYSLKKNAHAESSRKLWAP
jgi:hypothetical protein